MIAKLEIIDGRFRRPMALFVRTLVLDDGVLAVQHIDEPATRQPEAA